MKNALMINFEKNQIVMTSLFAKKCSDTSSEEYARLQSVRQDYPNYDVITRQIKKKKGKKSYKGLTYEYMEDYIMTHEPEETMMDVLDEFSEMRIISECHSQAFRYPVIKKWFLNKYPEIVRFGTLNAEYSA